jgi:hypothetical protein
LWWLLLKSKCPKPHIVWRYIFNIHRNFSWTKMTGVILRRPWRRSIWRNSHWHRFGSWFLTNFLRHLVYNRSQSNRNWKTSTKQNKKKTYFQNNNYFSSWQKQQYLCLESYLMLCTTSQITTYIIRLIHYQSLLWPLPNEIILNTYLSITKLIGFSWKI